jgi:hypothetical protein
MLLDLPWSNKCQLGEQLRPDEALELGVANVGIDSTHFLSLRSHAIEQFISSWIDLFVPGMTKWTLFKHREMHHWSDVLKQGREMRSDIDATL